MRKLTASVLVVLLAGFAGVVLLSPSVTTPSPRSGGVAPGSSVVNPFVNPGTDTKADASVEAALGPIVEATASAHGEIEPARDPELAADANVLIASVAEVDRPGASVTELQDLGTSLRELLLARPELGPAAAEALARGKTRETLLQLRRALRAVVDQGPVRAKLLEVAAYSDRDEPREAAIHALGGLQDRGALSVFARVLSDERAGELARSAAAYELSRDIEALAPAERTACVNVARALASSRTASARVRADSFELVGRAGLDDADRGVARTAAADPEVPDEVALAAARALVTNGESRVEVARALRGRTKDADEAITAMLDRLEGKEGK